MRWIRGGLRFGLVSIGIIVLTSFGIDASDTLRTSQTALGILARDLASTDACPDGTVELITADVRWCIDRFENSASTACLERQPRSSVQSQSNLAIADCTAESKSGSTPWTHVTFHQAKALCAKRGMQLPSNALWYELALGTSDDERVCNLRSGKTEPAGERSQCQSARGAYDAIGNVWEWVDAAVENGRYQNRAVPEEGYVLSSDVHGIALLTTSSPQRLSGDDYFWSNATGSYAMMRGGFYNSGSDGGVYSVYAEAVPDFSSEAIGFRCVTPVS